MEFIPGTNVYKIRKGLNFVDSMTETELSTERERAYHKFTAKIDECMEKGCAENSLQLREMADAISPGLGNVDSVWTMIDVVKKDFPK